MNRLKLGDRVRVRPDWYNGYQEGSCYNLPKGEEGEIVAYHSDESIEVRYAGKVTPAVNGNGFELVSTGPVRTETVTKRRIVPGVYGRLRVGQAVNIPDCDRPDEPPRVEVDIELTGGYGMTATELDDLAMVASQLAEALRDLD